MRSVHNADSYRAPRRSIRKGVLFECINQLLRLGNFSRIRIQRLGVLFGFRRLSPAFSSSVRRPLRSMCLSTVTRSCTHSSDLRSRLSAQLDRSVFPHSSTFQPLRRLPRRPSSIRWIDAVLLVHRSIPWIYKYVCGYTTRQASPFITRKIDAFRVAT